MAKITDLSNELLLDIVSHLSTGNRPDVATLVQLCQTSHRFLDIAQPMLYASIVVSESRCLSSLHSLRKTLIQWPSLANKTTTLALCHNAGVDNEWDEASQNAILAELSPPMNYNHEKKSDVSYYAMAVDVLARLPNLQHLCFTAASNSPWMLMEQLREVRRDEDILPQLKTFHLNKKYENGPVNLSSYVQLLQYPSFEKFTSQNDVPDVLDECPATNSVTHTEVELLWCLSPRSTMKSLLNTCDRLTRFKFVAPSGNRFNWNWDMASIPAITPHDLAEDLCRTHGQSLESLHLEFSHYYDFRHLQPLQNADFTYPSFRGFACLTHLEIEFNRLESLRHLPESLECLALVGCGFDNHWDREYLLDLIKLRKTSCPVIEYVRICGWDYDGGFAAIGRLAESLDLRISVTVGGRWLEILGLEYYLVIRVPIRRGYIAYTHW